MVSEMAHIKEQKERGINSHTDSELLNETEILTKLTHIKLIIIYPFLFILILFTYLILLSVFHRKYCP